MAAHVTNPAPGYIHGTKYELPIMLYERGGDIISVGKVVVLYDGRKIAVLKRSVPDTIRNELFHGLDLDKIVNEEGPVIHPDCPAYGKE